MKRYQCITAIECLDEGVDVPSVRMGIILASTRDPKQYIQRRGRLLRKDEDNGKTHAVIYDMIVKPPPSDQMSSSDKKMVARELRRCKEFADAAENQEEALKNLKKIAAQYNIELSKVDNDEYIRKLTSVK